MKTFTMKNFDYEYACEHRNDVLNDVKVGSKIVLDNIREFVITEIREDRREKYQSYFTMKPINKTLEARKNEFDHFAKVNSQYYTVGNYPSFETEIESIWFFSRNAKIYN